MNNIIFKTILLKGEAGNDIQDIEKTATSGMVDTYTITLTDGTTATFEVTNGRGIVSIEKTAAAIGVDTYTITYNDNTTSTFEVPNYVEGAFYSPLFGKNVCFFGDSIMRGVLDDGTTSASPFCKQFCDAYGANYFNFAVSGATASNIQENNFSKQITDNLTNVAKCDVAFIMFGANDYTNNVALGDPRNLTSLTNSFIRGIHEGIQAIQTATGGCEVVLIKEPMGTVWNNWYTSNSNGTLKTEYQGILQEYAARTNIRVLDLMKNGISNLNRAEFYGTSQNHPLQTAHDLFARLLISQYGNGDHNYFDNLSNLYPTSNDGFPVNLFAGNGATTDTSYPNYYYGSYYQIGSTPIASKVFGIVTSQMYNMTFYAKMGSSSGGKITVKFYDETGKAPFTKVIDIGGTNITRVSFNFHTYTTWFTAGACHITIESTNTCYVGGFALGLHAPAIPTYREKRNITPTAGTRTITNSCVKMLRDGMLSFSFGLNGTAEDSLTDVLFTIDLQNWVIGAEVDQSSKIILASCSSETAYTDGTGVLPILLEFSGTTITATWYKKLPTTNGTYYVSGGIPILAEGQLV